MTEQQDPDHTIRLKEWELRHQSYISYRGQYLTMLSITASTWFVGLIVALGDRLSEIHRPAVMGCTAIILGGCIVGHINLIKAIRSLGQRLDDLERELDVHTFRTTWPLESAARWSLGILIVATTFTLGIFVWTLVA